MKAPRRRVGFVGAGFIADYHAVALRCVPGAELVAVCDPSGPRRQACAARHGIPHAYVALDEMLAEQPLDVVHVLTPPDHHCPAALAALNAGAHVLLEKPMGAELAACTALLEQAAAAGRRVGVNHNLLFFPGYERLRDDVRAGRLGRPDHVRIVWNYELPQLRSGPFDAWMLRDPRHIVLEIGAHLVAYLLDLVGVPDRLSVRPGLPLELPNGQCFHRRWRIEAEVGRTAVELLIALQPGFAERSVHVRGDIGSATADLELATYTRQLPARGIPELARYFGLTRMARALRRQARRNLWHAVLAKIDPRRHGTPFQESITRSVQAFHAGLAGDLDPRVDGRFGRDVVAQCQRVIATSEVVPRAPRPAAPHPPPQIPPDTLVLGGTGFIGGALVRKLLDRGHVLRLLSRSADAGSANGDGRLQVLRGDMRVPAELARAVAGVRFVYHLARGSGKSRADYLAQEVLPAQELGEICLREGVQRLIYTGTIASLYTGAGAGVITDRTSLDPHIDQRDHYAYAKAAAEAALLRLHRERGLPVVVLRPGIVIGAGSSPYHWGVGQWTGGGVCELWGDGRHKLPFVLVDDVADALVAALDAPGIEGECFNLVAGPCLSARDYVREFERYAGVRLQVIPTPIWRYYLADVGKWLVKTLARHPGRQRPSYRDWESRTARAVFDCAHARDRLGWQPASAAADIIERGIRAPTEALLR